MPFDLATAYANDYVNHDNAEQVTWIPQGGSPVVDIWAVPEDVLGTEVQNFSVVGMPNSLKAFWLWSGTITGGGTPAIGDTITDANAMDWIVKSVNTRQFEPTLRVAVQESR